MGVQNSYEDIINVFPKANNHLLNNVFFINNRHTHCMIHMDNPYICYLICNKHMKGLYLCMAYQIACNKMCGHKTYV